MKLHQLICEEAEVTLEQVRANDDLIDPKTKKYYTGEVSVTGDVNLFAKNLSKLPVKFGKVGGSFYCYTNKLTSLEGAPSSVGGNFDCLDNKLTSLDGAPSSVGGYFYCDNNKLTSLKGAPSSVSDYFSCENNHLTSLEGIHKIIKKIDGRFWCTSNPIKSGGIGLILVEGLTKIFAGQPAFEIIEKYLGQGKKGVLLCQDELIEAGFEEYAKL